jgi:hypothetical protein
MPLHMDLLSRSFAEGIIPEKEQGDRPDLTIEILELFISQSGKCCSLSNNQERT